MNLAMLPVTAETDGEENGTETLRDGRVIGVLTSPDQTYERTWFIGQDEWLSLSFECSLCTVLLEIDGTTTEITNQIAYQAIQSGTASMKISSPVAEFVSYSLIERIDETNPTVRPSPGEAFNSQEAWLCSDDHGCADLPNSLEAVPSTEFIDGEFVLGVVENNQAEYVAVPADAGQTLELQLLHATQDLSIHVYFQTETEVQLNGNLTQPTALQTNLRPDAEFWHAEYCAKRDGLQTGVVAVAGEFAALASHITAARLLCCVVHHLLPRLHATLHDRQRELRAAP